MTAFGTIPLEPPTQHDLTVCAPQFTAAVWSLMEALVARGYPPKVFETLRTPERQAWLYGFARDYDDGRGRVTGARTAWDGWHAYGLAADIIHRDRGWKAPAFFDAMRAALPAHGLDFCVASDWPHVQWGKCDRKPGPEIKALYDSGGLPAVWAHVGAA